MSTEASRSRYLSGSVANMIRSLVVILGLLAVLVFAVARQSSISQPPVDVESSAADVAASSGWAIERPVGLPEGWQPTSVRYVRSTDGLKTWHVGYQTPDGDYIAIEQTKEATSAWIRAQTSRGTAQGSVAAGGRTWTTYLREGKVQRSLVHEPDRADGLTTIVTGTAPFVDLEAFADRLEVGPGS
jgi:hypothetical protein